MPQSLSETKTSMFADDTNLTASGQCIKEVETAVNSDLDSNLRKWLMANKLSLNVADRIYADWFKTYDNKYFRFSLKY